MIPGAAPLSFGVPGGWRFFLGVELNSRTKGKKAGAANDIGRETRLELYRLQVELRVCEKRAYDLFLQNLI
jgi:hypothetical protein